MTLRSLGDVVDGRHRTRAPRPARRRRRSRARLQIRRVLRGPAHDAVPDGPERVPGLRGRPRHPARPRRPCDRVRAQVLRQHQRNLATDTALQLLARRGLGAERDAERDGVPRAGSRTTSRSRRSWRPGGRQLDPREVLLWLADPRPRLPVYARGPRPRTRPPRCLASMRQTLETGDLVGRRRRPHRRPGRPARAGPGGSPREERGFYEIEELDDVAATASARSAAAATPDRDEPAYDA